MNRFYESGGNKMTSEDYWLSSKGSDAEKENESSDPSKCSVVDSMLEYYDPTPSIHDLFVVFNERFFWGKLGAVEVKWSPRMTLCAGLCYYQGRGGLCSIRLSAPLLRLRPRKNLVETLLHEMIHAYLYVTQNNKDREDHGPEFRKHMHRINKIAGTNITVYHDFMDEVRFYQTHVWRCNGPCKDRRPYYGFIRRAMNRAPGPNDRWWADHQKSCNGQFVKVAGPESNAKKGVAHNGKNKEAAKDIRTFFPKECPGGESLSQGINKVSPKSINKVSPRSINKVSPKSINKVSPKVNSKVTSKGNNKVSTKVINKVSPNGKSGILSNVYTIKDLQRLPSSPAECYRPHRIQQDTRVAADSEFSSPACDSGRKADLEALRSIWSSKFPSPPKREGPEIVLPMESKRREVDEPLGGDSPPRRRCNGKEFRIRKVSRWLNHASDQSFGSSGPEDAEDDPNLDRIGDDDDDGDGDVVSCPVCYKMLKKDELFDHLESCAECSIAHSDPGVVSEEGVAFVPCPCCSKAVPEKSINSHVDECLTLIYLKDAKDD